MSGVPQTPTICSTSSRTIQEEVITIKGDTQIKTEIGIEEVIQALIETREGELGEHPVLALMKLLARFFTPFSLLLS